MRRALLAALLLAAPPAPACDGLQLVGPWIREAPPGARAMAGYVRLRNEGRDDLRIEAISSPAFGAVEIHRTVMANNQMRMLRESDIVLKPGDERWLAPGGWHLMLFRPQRPLTAGDRATIEFRCGERSRSADFTVRVDG